MLKGRKMDPIIKTDRNQKKSPEMEMGNLKMVLLIKDSKWTPEKRDHQIVYTLKCILNITPF